VATLWISKATPSQSYVESLLRSLALFGIGAGSCFLPLSVTILTGVPRADAGAASGMLQTMQQTGGALGVAALTSIAAAHGSSDALTDGCRHHRGGVPRRLLLHPSDPFERAPTAEEAAEEMIPLLLSE
jgi:hypothetical protein